MNVAKIAKKIVKQCRIDNPKHFKLDDHDPAERFGLSTDIAAVRPILAKGIAKHAELQQRPSCARSVGGAPAACAGVPPSATKTPVPHAVNAEFTLIREPGTVTKAVAMSFRRDVRAMTRGAAEARSGAARMPCKILVGLLLLSAP
jgi:hypothetical protein